jgi:hypothetical protein
VAPLKAQNGKAFSAGASRSTFMAKVMMKPRDKPKNSSPDPISLFFEHAKPEAHGL